MSNFLIFIILSFSTLALAVTETPTGIPLDTEWKLKLNEFASKHVVHQSWGYPHSERNFQNTLKLAKLEGIKLDEDILFAASFLHDLGGLPPYEQEGVDHGKRSADIGIPLLISFGFPEHKLEEVREVIIGHVYYGPKPSGAMARLFRDADILDFLGTMGIARLLAANAELGDKPAITNSIKTIKALMEKLPKELSSKSSKAEAKVRLKEMNKFLQTFDAYTYSGQAL